MNARVERLTFGHGTHLAVPGPPVAVAAALAHEPQPVRLTRVETWDWGWGGLLLFSVLLFLRPQDQIPGLGNSHASDLAAFIGLSGMVFVNLSRREPITRVTPELIGMAALGAVMVLTIPTSFWPGGSFAVFSSLYMSVALIFLLMINTVTSPRRIERICRTIVLAFGYMSVLVIFNYLRGVNVVDGRAVGPVGGFFQNPNDLALNLVTFLPLAMMYVKRPGPLPSRLLYAVITLLMFIALIMTKSRGGMLGLVLMLGTFLLVSRSLTPATMIAGILSGVLVLPALPDSFWQRMASITQPELDPNGSREERRRLLEQGLRVFLDHPLTGVGAGQFVNYDGAELEVRWRETHNVLLEVATELGVFGLAAFVFLIVRGFTAAWWTRRELSWIYRRRTRKKRADPPADVEDGLAEHERSFLQTHGAAMLAAMVGWLACAMFASVALNWTFYYVLGLSVTGRDVVRHRAHAYAEAKRLQTERVVIA